MLMNSMIRYVQDFLMYQLNDSDGFAEPAAGEKRTYKNSLTSSNKLSLAITNPTKLTLLKYSGLFR